VDSFILDLDLLFVDYLLDLALERFTPSDLELWAIFGRLRDGGGLWLFICLSLYSGLLLVLSSEDSWRKIRPGDGFSGRHPSPKLSLWSSV
jgi:hypothetical protein